MRRGALNRLAVWAYGNLTRCHRIVLLVLDEYLVVGDHSDQ